MDITINLTPQAEEALRDVFGSDLSTVVKEALLIKAYQQGQVSLGFLTEELGLETTILGLEWLAERGIPINYGLEDLQIDRQMIAKYYHPDRSKA